MLVMPAGAGREALAGRVYNSSEWKLKVMLVWGMAEEQTAERRHASREEKNSRQDQMSLDAMEPLGHT